MAFAVRKQAAVGVVDRDPTTYVLEDGAGAVAEIWPALGFNCYRWEVEHTGRLLDLLYSDPALFTDGRPTRSGIPILFPFPNRIRGGQYTWDGKSYQLPLNDGPKQNAIHGFACRRPWRVVGEGADEAAGAWVTGEFQGSKDAADCVGLWPADYILRVTYRLVVGGLRIEAEVTNPDDRPLPFGLGYHPYFRIPFSPEVKAEECTVSTPARSFWALTDALPDGTRHMVDSARDLNTQRRFGELQLDDVLTDLPPATEPFPERGSIVATSGRALSIRCDADFREMVVFTPGNRQAFCIEPYTCTTDAINLQARGVDAGLLVLPPGGTWKAAVGLHIQSFMDNVLSRK
jgi:aldose 1-epimerase